MQGMKGKALQQHIDYFDCQFTHEIRQMFQQRRFSLGVTYQRAAMFFGVSWTTVRKWEYGPTVVCNPRHRMKIEGFINGAYNGEFEDGGNPFLNSPIYQRMPADMRACMDKFTNTYLLCQHRRDLCDMMLNEAERIAHDILQQLLQQPFTY